MARDHQLNVAGLGQARLARDVVAVIAELNDGGSRRTTPADLVAVDTKARAVLFDESACQRRASGPA